MMFHTKSSSRVFNPGEVEKIEEEGSEHFDDTPLVVIPDVEIEYINHFVPHDQIRREYVTQRQSGPVRIAISSFTRSYT